MYYISFNSCIAFQVEASLASVLLAVIFIWTKIYDKETKPHSASKYFPLWGILTFSDLVH